MDHTKEFMGDDKDRLFIALPFGSFFGVDLLEDGIDADDPDGHQEKHPTQTFIASFRDVTSTFPLPGFIDGGIEAGISDKFLRCGEGTAVGFGQEVRDSDHIEAGDRVEDLQWKGNLIAAALEKKFRHFLQFLLEERQDADFRAKDRFEVGRGEADRGSGCFDQVLESEGGLAAPSRAGQELAKGLGRGLKEGVFGGEGGQQAERRGGEGVKEAEDLGENEGEIAFDLVLERNDLAGDIFSRAGQSSKFIVGRVGLGQGLGVGPKELGDGGGITLVGLGFTQGELGEVRDGQGIEQPDVKALSLEEREQVQIIRAGRFHSEPKRAERRARQAHGTEEVSESVRGHGKRTGPKDLPLLVDQGGMEAILSDIDAAETDTHGFTSSGIMRFEAGDASRPILHYDEGSRTQSTYQDSGGQRTDSLEGSWAQEKWSSPASSLSFYSIDKAINNINS
jgi:hypothetical protein